jgi:MFS family permease
MPPATPFDGSSTAGRSLKLVAAVAALNVLSYVDRQLVVALAPLLIADLGLTRADIGLLVGVVFMLLYAVGTQVVGTWADRRNRPRLIALGLAIWSLATALTSTATGLGTLAFWRALVGIGEAALPATALSMLGDRVPARHLGLASGVFYAGVPVGFGLSLALSGAIAPRLGWRACFAALGALGLLGALLVLRLDDPPRRGGAPAGRAGPSVRAVLRERPAILALTLAGVLLVYSSAASQHTITWLVSERGFGYAHAAFQSAAVTLVAGLAGNLAIGALTDRAGRAHPAGRLVSLALVSGLGLLAALAFYSLAPGSGPFIASWCAAQAFLLGWYGSLVAAVHERAPDGCRATVIGFLLLAINLIGVGSGPYITGLLADRASLTLALQWSVLPGALGTLLLAGVGLAEWRGRAA